jgi:NADH-quinone oxidoreductase subunit J
MFLENLVIIFLLFMTLCVIFLNNPIQSLLSLIICFAISSIFFLILGLEFISIVLFIIYIGAIAVLFLFIIMMLNIKIIELSSSYLRYLPIGSFIILFFFLEMCFFFFVEFNNNFYYDFLDFD